jgi:hypothetical protein
MSSTQNIPRDCPTQSPSVAPPFCVLCKRVGYDVFDSKHPPRLPHPNPLGCPTILRFVQKGGIRCLRLTTIPSAAPPNPARLPHHFASCAKGWDHKASPTLFVTNTKMVGHPQYLESKRVGSQTASRPTLFVTNTKMVGHPQYLESKRVGPRTASPTLFVTNTKMVGHPQYPESRRVGSQSVSHPFRKEHENGGASSISRIQKGGLTKRVSHPFRKEHENGEASSISRIQKGGLTKRVSHPFRKEHENRGPSSPTKKPAPRGAGFINNRTKLRAVRAFADRLAVPGQLAGLPLEGPVAAIYGIGRLTEVMRRRQIL